MDRKDSTNEVFSPARWRQDSKEVVHEEPEITPLPVDTTLPRGDPLGVLYNMLEEDPDVLMFMNACPSVVPRRFTKRKAAIDKKALNSFKNTLVLDLDETLVHCTTEAFEVKGKPDAVFEVTFNGVDYTVYMNKRPYLDAFLDEVSKWFEVVVFTASQKCYADKLLETIDPEGKRIAHRLFRGSCAHYMDNFLKPLGILGRELKNCVIIDNSPQCFAFEVDSGIPCTSWFDDQRDNELMRLMPYLREMKDLDDLRPYLRKTFGVKEFLAYLKKELTQGEEMAGIRSMHRYKQQ